MWSTAREIAAGDLVIVWLTRELIQSMVITPGKEFNGRFGVYRHSDLIGIPYGSKVGSRNGKGFIHVLRPTPELWTMALPHRTQILYLADIAFVTSWLAIKPGSRVIEAGTGSGSFSHSVARTIGSQGRLYSYEFHATRARKAQEEFCEHGLSDIIELTHRNVCKDGFTVADEVDSVFLDLPAPWEAVCHAKVALRKDRAARICCFSPCMEQVLRTVSALNEHGFTQITMYETLLRPHEVNTIPKLLSVSEVSYRLKQAEVKREQKRQRQILAAATKRAKGKRKRDDADDADEFVKDPILEDAEDNSKRAKVDDEILESDLDGNAATAGAVMNVKVLDTQPDNYLVSSDVHVTASLAESQNVTDRFNVSKVMSEVRGHTSYLTFAVLLPPIPSVHAISSDVSQDQSSADAINHS